MIISSLYVAFQDVPKPIFKSKTLISPISTFDEFKYENYNLYIKNSTNDRILDEKKLMSLNLDLNEYNLSNEINYDQFILIDKYFLVNLFIEKIREDKFLKTLNNKFNLKNKIYVSKDINNSRNWKIEIITEDKKKTELILNYIENQANLEIQKFLKEKFDNDVLSQEKLKKYKIEDINIKIESFVNNEVDEIKDYVEFLYDLKKLLSDNKNKARILSAFSTTPIFKENNFRSAIMSIDETEFKIINEQKNNHLLIIIISSLFGLFIGILYVITAKGKY